jgi:Kef-type K+ transport system membrane component KefB
MENLTQHDLTVIFLSLGVLLGVARVLGELAQKLHQPAVLGELVAGVLLGPTVLGNIAPGLGASFPRRVPLRWRWMPSRPGIVLFLLVAGIEVDLSTLWRQGRVGGIVGIAAIVIPFLCGLATAWLVPQALGRQPEADPLIFALFFAIALSISALPVIAKTFMDMGLYRSDLGMVVISAAVFNDLFGWILFAVVLGLMGGGPAGTGNSIALTPRSLAFTAAMLVLGRWLIHRALPYVQAYTRWPGGELSFALVLAILAAGFTEWIGIHAIFGAFLVGIAVGDSSHLRERSRVIIEQFVSSIFAPVFFASIGLRVNFLTHFDLSLVLTVLLISCVAKLAGGTLGARLGGMTPREAWAVRFMNPARMEIIPGAGAGGGIIRQRLFVALVVMAIATSMMSGRLSGLLRPARSDGSRTCFPRGSSCAASGGLRRGAIRGDGGACEVSGLDPSPSTPPSGPARGPAPASATVALPHARLEGLRSRWWRSPFRAGSTSTHRTTGRRRDRPGPDTRR